MSMISIQQFYDESTETIKQMTLQLQKDVAKRIQDMYPTIYLVYVKISECYYDNSSTRLVACFSTNKLASKAIGSGRREIGHTMQDLVIYEFSIVPISDSYHEIDVKILLDIDKIFDIDKYCC